MNIVIVGSRSFPVVKAGVALCEWLAAIDTTAVIHTRGGKHGFDAFIAEAANFMGYQVRVWPADGGAANFIRDVEMVKDADAVFAFFDGDHIGEGGTQHVVEKSLDQHKRTNSYIWNGYKLLDIGSADGGEGQPQDDEGRSAGQAQVAGEAATERTRRRSEVPQTVSRGEGPVWPGRDVE